VATTDDVGVAMTEDVGAGMNTGIVVVLGDMARVLVTVVNVVECMMGKPG
jgi:hypothetical protein